MEVFARLLWHTHVVGSQPRLRYGNMWLFRRHCYQDSGWLFAEGDLEVSFPNDERRRKFENQL
jgi:hypothetical protein